MLKDKTRLLRKMEEEAKGKQLVEREKRITKKYHKVRFVDRQKVSRKLARVDKQLSKIGAAASEVSITSDGRRDGHN